MVEEQKEFVTSDICTIRTLVGLHQNLDNDIKHFPNMQRHMSFKIDSHEFEAHAFSSTPIQDYFNKLTNVIFEGYTNTYPHKMPQVPTKIYCRTNVTKSFGP